MDGCGAEGKAKAANGVGQLEGWVPRVSTTEMLAVFFWESMVMELVGAHLSDLALHEIRIEETDKNSVTYRGECA